jgi:hypothetical protein
VKQENGTWRKRYHCGLYEKFNEPNIINDFVVKILARTGHLVRVDNDITLNKIFKTKPNGLRIVGISKLQSEHGVYQGTRILEVKNWKKFALERDAVTITPLHNKNVRPT